MRKAICKCGKKKDVYSKCACKTERIESSNVIVTEYDKYIAIRLKNGLKIDITRECENYIYLNKES